MSERQMRVLHTLGWVTHGGVEHLRLLMAEGLPKDKYEHAVICQEATVPMKVKFEREGWTVHEIGLAPHILSLRWYWRAILIGTKFKPDVIHGAVFEGSALAVVIGFFSWRSKVIIEEQSDGRNRSWRGTMLMRLLSQLSDRTVGVAPSICDYLRKKVGVSDSKLELVNNGARGPLTSYASWQRNDMRAELGISSDEIVIGSMGRLNDDHKRFSDLIRSLPALLKGNPKIKLLILGEGDDRNSLEGLVDELDLGDSVLLLGFQEDVHRYLHLMDIFALVSSGEALPLALVEAMHAGLPCVATEVGGNPYVLNFGESGVLVNPGDRQALVAALGALVGNPQARRELGGLARARAKKNFSPPIYLSSVEKLWEKTLGDVRG